ncbi:MAG TPA: hypothetical protein VGO62_05080 [Myxococcota bacterium]|jgi:hypothetical protein
MSRHPTSRNVGCLAISAWVAASAACVFAPDIAGNGYGACASDADCTAPNACALAEKLCAPPPWNDVKFQQRRALVVKNGAPTKLAAGTAVPVVVGTGGVLALADVAPDFRVTSFDGTAHSWSVAPVFLDKESDRFTVWVATARDIAQGKSDTLAWFESESDTGAVATVDDPADVFLAYDGFDDGLDGTAWQIEGAPNVADGIVNVAAGQVIVLKKPLVPPLQLTALVRVNGTDCSRVFIGLIGDTHALLEVPPSAGLLIDQSLAASASVAPQATDVPTGVGDPFTAQTVFQHLTIGIDGRALLVRDDDTTLFDRDTLPDAFGTDPMFFAVQVGGDCSVDVDEVWATPLPDSPRPAVTAGPLVTLDLDH